MVFKNPYGYLIKHFKLIHFILCIMYIYLAINVRSILQYYNLFIRGTASKLEAITYVNNLYLWVIGASIIICCIVYALMRYKKKPRLLYLILIVVYFIVGIMIYIVHQGLGVIYISVLEVKTLRLYRDLLSIMIWIQYISIIFVLVRAMGFDIKKFNFVDDLADLHLEEKDEEEIELTLGGTESVQRRFHRRIRELRYYYLENKTFILIFAAILVAVMCSGIFVHKEVVAKEYREGEIFSTDEYQFNVLNTFITSKDYSNKTFSNADTTYVVVRMSLAPNHSFRAFNTSNLILKVNYHSYSSSSKYAYKFIDLGYGYKDSKIRGRETYLFIYNIDKEDANKKMTLEYANEKVVRLSPINLDEVSSDKEFKLNDDIDLSKSTLNGGHFSVSSFEVDKSFNYTYQYEVMGKQNTGNLTISANDGVILHLVVNLSLPYDFTSYSFLSTLGKFKYKVGEDVFTSNLFVDKTPGSYKDGLYILVDKEVMNASSMWFEITIRNCKYVYTLK